MPAMRYPTSPGPRLATGVGTGMRTPISSASCVAFACTKRSLAPLVSVPSNTRTALTTPRYGS